MSVAVLLAAAAIALWWPQIVDLASKVDVPSINRRHWAAAILAVAAAGAYVLRPPTPPEPSPAPPAPDSGIVLQGAFIGPTAAADAQLLEAFCDEIASCLEQDGMRDQPRLTSGAAFDDLRVSAREGRMRGESLGARQPHVRDAIHEYLDRAVGVSGGPVSPEQRARWITAYRTIARAAASVTR